MMRKKKNFSPLFILILIFLLTAGLYLVKEPINLGLVSTLQPSPKLTETSSYTVNVVLEGEFWFNITVPPYYKVRENHVASLTKDAAKILNERGEVVLDIYTYAAGEESGRGREIIIDGVPFYIGYGNEIECGNYLGASNWVPGTEPLFDINIWCEKATDQELKTYSDIISSIKFSPALKKVLLGVSESK